jgi:hypothetical protein
LALRNARAAVTRASAGREAYSTGGPELALFVQYRDMVYILFRYILYSFGLWNIGFQPAIDDRRSLVGRIEFPDQSAAVVDQHPLFNGY